jgi:DNA repair protein RecO (recombination protein O)
MNTTLNGIYLGHTNYSDTSVIARVFTAQFGRKSFLFKGVKTKKGQAGLLMPCNHLEFVCNYHPSKELNVVYSLHLKEPRATLCTDIRKTTVALFLTEILSKSLHVETDEPELYRFLTEKLNSFDQERFSPVFHLFFLLQLAKYLGFYPKYGDTYNERFFNLREGVFDANSTDIYHLDATTTQLLIQLIRSHENGCFEVTFTPAERNGLLKALVQFYEVQLDNCTINSLEVLTEVFSG